MKYLKYCFFFTVIFVAFTSCLKDRSSVTELYNDKGSIVTSISETAYMNTQNEAIGAGYDRTVANLNFTNRPNEAVKFFTLKISQPRATKVNGPLVIKVTTSAISGLTAVPSGAIKVTDITVPASTDNLIVFPVLFTVNKTLLDPAEIYGVRFTLNSANQGAINTLENVVDVYLNYSDFSANTNMSDYEANYTYASDIVDPANQFGIHNRNTRYLIELAPNTLGYQDQYYYALSGASYQNLVANNFSTGAVTSLFRPNFVLSSSGQVTSVLNASSTASVTNLALDPSGLNKFIYTANNKRTLDVKYSFTLTTTINGVVTPRKVSVSESFKYDPEQIYF